MFCLYLYLLRLELLGEDRQVTEDLVERFGMRQLTVGQHCLLLNGEPIFVRLATDEFNRCPTISPIVDEASPLR